MTQTSAAVTALPGAPRACPWMRKVAPHLPPLDRALPPRAETIYQAARGSRRRQGGDGRRHVHGADVAAGRQSGVRAVAAIHLRSARGRRPAAEVRDLPKQRTGLGVRARARSGSAGRAGKSCCRRRRTASRWRSTRSARRRAASPCGSSMSARARRRRPMKARTSRARWCSPAARSSQVWNFAARARGAAGVISTAIAPYTRPADTPDVLQWGSIPYVESLQSFGFKATPRVGDAAARRAGEGPGHRCTSISRRTFHRRPNRTLVVEIPGRIAARSARRAGRARAGAGRERQRQRLRHVARRRARHPGRHPPRRAACAGADASPFCGSTKSRGSRQWIKDHPDQVKGVVAMLSLDMTGEDTTKTGGTFLIEKEPDPSAVWERPSDPHSEWGAGKVDPAIVRGSFLNDLHLAVALAPRARYELGRAHQSLRGRQRSHGVHRAPACRRFSTGTSPIATTTPTSTPSTRSAPPKCSTSRSSSATTATVPGVGRPDRRWRR